MGGAASAVAVVGDLGPLADVAIGSATVPGIGWAVAGLAAVGGIVYSIYSDDGPKAPQELKI